MKLRQTKLLRPADEDSVRPGNIEPALHDIVAIEGFFAKLTKKRLKRGVFQSLRELKETIHRFLDHTNANPKPFTWTKDPNKIIAAVRRGHQVLDSIH